jgi:hypothetical protein
MSEGRTLAQEANAQRWCMAKVEEGQEKWQQDASWHPMRGHCKARGKSKASGEWRCAKHLPLKES